MPNELEQDLNKKTKPKKVANILVRVWDDGIVDARYTILDSDGRGPALKVPVEQKEFLQTANGLTGHGLAEALDSLVFPDHTNYVSDAGSEKPLLIGTASLDVYDDAQIISVFTEIVRADDRGAPRKNSTLRESEWKRKMSTDVGQACADLKLTVSYNTQPTPPTDEDETGDDTDDDFDDNEIAEL